MGEKKGYLFTLVFFIGIIVPALIMFGVDALNQSAFTKTTAEVGEMVKEEGGVTEKVAETVNELQRKGYEIRFTSNGNNVTSAVPYGTTIIADYKYNYHAGFFERELNISNKIDILKRDSVGSGNIEQGGIIRTITVNSNESDQAEQVQTWNIPNLKSVRNVMSNNGSAHVVNRQGENVTIAMNNGSPTRQELIKNGEVEDRKYVDGIDHEYYEDADGYKGILEKYLVRGNFIESETKYIEKHDEEYYTDAEGYTGQLERYFAGGGLNPKDTVEVMERLTSDVDKAAQKRTVTELVTSNNNFFGDSILYNKDGYKGTISKKGDAVQRLVAGEIVPSHTKFVNGEAIEDYSKDGYVGKLERYVASGEYIPEDTKFVTEQHDQYYNRDGYVGTLESYHHSGNFAPGETKLVTNYYKADYDVNGFKGTLEEYIYDYIGSNWTHQIILGLGLDPDPEESYPLTRSANGLLYQLCGQEDLNVTQGCTLLLNGNHKYKALYYARSYKDPDTGTFHQGLIPIYKYRGMVTSEGADNRIFMYQGTVTRPAQDTRQYAYRGYVTKPESDTRVYEYDQLYEGLVEQDTDVLFPNTIEYDKGGYKGVLSKDGEVTENLVSGEYVPYDEKYVENEESPDYNVDGYVGTLERYVSKGEFVPEDTKEAKKSLTSETYVPLTKKSITEVVTSEKNDFTDTIEYKNGGFEGTLYKYGIPKQIVVKGELTPSVIKNVTKTTVGLTGIFDETMEYHEDGFKGTLYKDGIPTHKQISGDYSPNHTKYVDNEDSPTYNKDNYTGTLESYLVSGSPASGILATATARTETPTWHQNVVRNDTYSYDTGVYSGELPLKSEKWDLVPQSVEVEAYYTQYSTDPNASELNTPDYDFILSEIIRQYGPDNPDGIYFRNPTIKSFTWDEPIQTGSFTDDKGQNYAHKRDATVVLLVDGFIYEALYEGMVTKPDDRVYKYRGLVTRPEVDTRVYEYHQNYTGDVVKPEVDTREFVYEQAYEGEVKEEGVDTFPEFVEYLEDNYVGTLTKDGEVRHELASGELIPYDEKYVEGLDSPYYNRDGYVGTLERYVASGTYTPSQTLSCSLVLDSSNASYLPATTVDNQCLTVNGNTNYILYSGTGNLTYSKSRTYTERRIATFNSQILSTNDLTNDAASSYASYFTSVPSSNGLANPGPITLSWLGSSRYEVKVQNGQTFYYVRPIAGQFDYDHQFAIYTTTYTIPAQDTRVYKYRGTVRRAEVDTRKYHYVQDYKGMVTKPESDTREYKYRGTVRRSESDTRKYEYVQMYKGNVTRPESDTREYAYHGNVSIPAEDTREYLYRGEVVKPAKGNTGETKPYYQYEVTIEYEAWE